MRRVAIAAFVLVTLAGCGSTLERARKAEAEGAYGEAQDLYERAAYDPKNGATAKPEFAAFLVGQGERVEKSDPDRAAEYYSRALQVQPGHDGALTHWVRMLRRSGRTQEAVDVIDKAAAQGPCGSCKRLRLVLLLEQGDKAMAEAKWDDAIAFYSKAQESRKQAAPEMAIALAHLQAGRNAEALTRLEGSIALIEQDPAMQETFVRIRRELVTIGLLKNNLEIADEASRVKLPGESDEVGVDMALEIADHVRTQGDSNAAMERYSAILDMNLTAEQRTAAQSRVMTAYRSRIALALKDGRAEEADQVIQKALELRPEDMQLRLQRLLAVARKIGSEVALSGLEKLSEDPKGAAKVKAALLALRAQERLDAGDIDGAKTFAAQAEELDPELPEVHLALAEIALQVPPEDLSRNDMRALRRSLVGYAGNVRRYAESLGELDLARAQLKAVPAGYSFYTPWFKPRADALETKIREVYPYKVEYRAEPEPQLVFENPRTDSIALDLYGPDGFEDAYELLPDTQQEITLPAAGLLRLAIDGENLTFFAESYAKVTVRL
jgi:tetratricopeptide (TPR) repeat protein